MYLLNGKPLSPDRAFTTEDGRQFPANWLRNSTPQERAELGITEAPPEPVYDQRFYWKPDLPKDLDDLKIQWKRQQKEIAQSLLVASDWVVTRAAEDPLKPVPESLRDYRQLVRSVSSLRELEIDGVSTVEELVELLNGQPTVFDPETAEEIPNTGLYLTPWPTDGISS